MKKPIVKKKGEVITVRELKKFVENLPEVDSYTGDEYEVWIRKGLVSNACKQLWPLNYTSRGFDIILSDDDEE